MWSGGCPAPVGARELSGQVGVTRYSVASCWYWAGTWASTPDTFEANMLTWMVPSIASPMVPPRSPMTWGSEEAVPICFLGAEFWMARKVGEGRPHPEP